MRRMLAVMDEIETDYLVVRGAAGMALVDTLAAERDCEVVVVDRRDSPGGHWNDAYPFVRLHQPSASYGVNSQAPVFATNQLSPDTYGGALVQLLPNYVHGRPEGTTEEVEAWTTEQRQPDAAGEFFFSVRQFCFTATRPED